MQKDSAEQAKMNKPELHVSAWTMEVGKARHLQPDTLIRSQKYAQQYMHGYSGYKDMHKNENIKPEYWNQVTSMGFTTSLVFCFLAT